MPCQLDDAYQQQHQKGLTALLKTGENADTKMASILYVRFGDTFRRWLKTPAEKPYLLINQILGNNNDDIDHNNYIFLAITYRHIS